MPYLEKNRVGRDAIDSAKALIDMGKYLYQERRLPTYDIAVAITKYVAVKGRERTGMRGGESRVDERGKGWKGKEGERSLEEWRGEGEKERRWVDGRERGGNMKG